MTDLASISAGQFIVTDNNAGIGLEWGSGGSLRVDKNTRIEFMSADSVYLHSGQLYFDSEPSTLSASISAGSNEIVAAVTGSGFEIETDHGLVRHLGTQYMTLADADKLSVRVREGEVAVDGVYVEEAVAVAGQQMTLSGGARPSLLDIDRFGEAWDWIEATAPVADVDGRSVDEFLTWIGRETGLQISYASPDAKQMAQNGVLRGNVDMAPRDELAFRMSGEDLSYRIDGGTIYVSIDSGSRP
jgi:ferric-dicitrate binding protein FerR (iron transport regulator)